MIQIEIALLYFRFTAPLAQKTARVRDRLSDSECSIKGYEKWDNKIEQDPYFGLSCPVPV